MRGVETADVRGVLVRLGSARIGLARATEIGEMLATIGAKMPVWCHADEYSNGTLALAARGCKRVWVAPASSVDAIGLAAQTIYFHKLLADEIGLDVDFLQVGKFKGAEEPFTRDGPSPEARQSLESTMADLRVGVARGHRTTGRPRAEAAAEDGPYTPDGARERGPRRRRRLPRPGAQRRSRPRRAPSGRRSGSGRARRAAATGWPTCSARVAGDSLGTAPVVARRGDGRDLDGGRRRAPRRRRRHRRAAARRARSRGSSTTTTSRPSSCASTRRAAARWRATSSGTS